MANLILPESLVRFCQGDGELSIQNLAALEATLKQAEPKLFSVLFSEAGLNGFVNLYLNDELVEDISQDIALKDNDTLEFISSVSGG